MCFNRKRKVRNRKNERYAVMFYMYGSCRGVYKWKKQKENFTQ